MKPLALAAALALLAGPALAQNAGQIASARAGKSCAGCNLFQADFSRAELERASALTQRQLDPACGDVGTTLPSGLSVPACR